MGGGGEKFLLHVTFLIKARRNALCPDFCCCAGAWYLSTLAWSCRWVLSVFALKLRPLPQRRSIAWLINWIDRCSSSVWSSVQLECNRPFPERLAGRQEKNNINFDYYLRRTQWNNVARFRFCCKIYFNIYLRTHKHTHGHWNMVWFLSVHRSINAQQMVAA